MNFGRKRGHFVVYANRYIFAIGGACDRDEADRVKIEMYDATNNKWTIMGNLAVAVHNQVGTQFEHDKEFAKSSKLQQIFQQVFQQRLFV
jgi:hypothetical protein